MTFDLKSWLIGFALGLAGKPLPYEKNDGIEASTTTEVNG